MGEGVPVSRAHAWNFNRSMTSRRWTSSSAREIRRQDILAAIGLWLHRIIRGQISLDEQRLRYEAKIFHVSLLMLEGARDTTVRTPSPV